MASRKIKDKINGLSYKDFKIGWRTLIIILVSLYLILNFKFNINLGFVSCGSEPVDIHYNKK